MLFVVVKCVLVASPGFVKDQFCEYMFQQAIKNDWKVISDNKSRFILVSVKCFHFHIYSGVKIDGNVDIIGEYGKGE